MAEGKKASRASKSRPPPPPHPLAQGLDPPLEAIIRQDTPINEIIDTGYITEEEIIEELQEI